MAALGAQLWFIREGRGERQRPRGSKVGVVRVRVLMRTWMVVSGDGRRMESRVIVLGLLKSG